MERRRIELEPQQDAYLVGIMNRGKEVQQELPLEEPAPRRKVALLDVADPKRQEGETVLGVTSRREHGVASNAFKIEPRAAAINHVTAWSSDYPPCSGFWDIKQKSARAEENVRLWFDAGSGLWWNPNVELPEGTEPPPKVPHAIFVQSHQWRGLEQRPTEGYPYDLGQYVSGEEPYPHGRRQVIL